ncbi:hypothetical protein GGF32_006363 [Allomyces javanicus]|nr:hypothetical protein GGF32_006363 [Allomyces javanicus]
MVWDSAQNAHRFISTHELDREICSGEFVMYLPLNPGATDVSVIQKTSVKKRNIKIYDILVKIWEWYNLRDIDIEAMQSLQASRVSKERIDKMFVSYEQGQRYYRFRDLIPETQRFVTQLTPEPGTVSTFVVGLGLKPSGPPSSSS